MKLKIGSLVAVAIVLGSMLFVMGTYVNYQAKTSAMQEHGVWSAETAGSVQLMLGQSSATIINLTGAYTRNPVLPSYQSYLSDIFSSGGSPFGEQPYNETVLFKVRVLVTAEDANHTKSKLFDETNQVRLAWSGGMIGIDGTVMSWDLHLGPYISHDIASPLKITSIIYIDGTQKAVKDTFVTIPRMVG